MKVAQSLRAATSVAAATFAFACFAGARAESIESKTQNAEAQVPTCSHRLGSAAIYEPENHWWEGLGLESPEALIKIIVQRSGCFTLLDRGKGFSVAEKERALASGGELRQGSNMGKGQMKAADYVIVPDIVSKNNNAGGTNIGGLLGGFVGGGAGAILGGISISKKTADVTLTVTDVRSSEQVAMDEGHASKSDVGFGVAGGGGWWGGFGAAGATNYANTEIGQVVTLAYINAYTKLVTDMGGLTPGGTDTVAQAVTMQRAGHLYTTASTKSRVVKVLAAGTMLYPTGNKDGVMWEVKDELGNQGWVSSLLLALSK
jgi:curli biogenesis system outer membrane secretion channel CsgG